MTTADTRPLTYHLYIDDSGSNKLDHNENKLGSQWFALGGLIILEDHINVVKSKIAAFKAKWGINYPLHSYEIRNKKKNFLWLSRLNQIDSNCFYAELTQLIIDLDYVAIACVISRAGYNARYKERYGQGRWKLSQTAFPILVERAVKYVAKKSGRLKVHFERSDKCSDDELLAMYQEMRKSGMPFNQDNSLQYNPIDSPTFSKILWDCDSKTKQSSTMQLADLVLFPMCVRKFDADHKAYKTLLENNKLIDCFLDNDQIPHEGIKYSCFEHQKAEAHASA